MHPEVQEHKNLEKKPSKLLFTEEHKELVKESEAWMKDTSTSCMVVATLIATIMFTAAFTVPGGNNSDQGIPIFLQASSFMVFAVSDAIEEKNQKDISWYHPLYKAALKADWESARRFFDLDPDAVTAKITSTSRTALQVAIGAGHSTGFVENLVELMPLEALSLKDSDDCNALCYTGITGNTKAAEILVRKNLDLAQMQDNWRKVPVLDGAQYGHRDTVMYLLSVTNDSLFTGMIGIWILNHLIVVGLYDIALHLVQKYPGLATYMGEKEIDCNGKGEKKSYLDYTPLYALAGTPSAFASGAHMTFWQKLIYAYHSVYEPLGIVFNKVSSNFLFAAPFIKRIRDTKLMHMQTLQLVKHICTEFSSLNHSEVMGSWELDILEAARCGVYEIVRECILSRPDTLWIHREDGRNVLQLAILHRQVNVYNLIYQMSSYKHFATTRKDKSGNNILHLAGKLAPLSQFNLVTGAALQMQRELQWFKNERERKIKEQIEDIREQEVEKIVQPSYRESKNSKGKSPKMVFTEEHKDLLSEGGVWMKDTSSSCMVVATLIATVMFAAAFTAPGGNNSNQGIPIFLENKFFLIFAISDAISLFSSTTSALMFLSILTSRYAEEDFQYALPKRLIIGLTTLFISIASMMIAFSATLSIIFSERVPGVAITLSLLSCVPVGLFALLQFPLLLELFLSTYGPSIFHKQNQDIIH
ncbi:hypothetical protein GIB67_026291 [Kingdonia uniflora]|uniref:PGG domain-containing protein n=1 Tax=Kingdonia uniflora TaxID=39325 RepID=A0A7J7LA55_9MAGN|nr:hypothetical protein GIB67_026291 [Kingdonia uniflora]